MRSAIHFISGLPRSGSTLLAAISVPWRRYAISSAFGHPSGFGRDNDGGVVDPSATMALDDLPHSSGAPQATAARQAKFKAKKKANAAEPPKSEAVTKAPVTASKSAPATPDWATQAGSVLRICIPLKFA